MTEIIKFLELIGTVAFAVSGAIVACGAGLDIFGVVFVGCITAFGGGMVRDILLDKNPPAIFTNYITFSFAVITAMAVFIIAYVNKEKFTQLKSKTEHINNFFDAVGLAAFSVTGAEAGFISGYCENALLIIIIGMITGVGGGIIRDVLIDTTPYIFKKHIYALASLSGSLIYFLLRHTAFNISLASAVSMLSVISIRLFATKYCWSLPRVIRK